jgi:hypothetical protein
LSTFSGAAVDMVGNMYRQSAHRTNITFLTPVSRGDSYNSISQIKIKDGVAGKFILWGNNYQFREMLCHSFWNVKTGSANRFL